MSRKKNSNKKNGFTLVELLVTIALMLSLLGIAIVSFINISNKRKEEAYELVKDQIMTAAEQYMDVNTYKYEGFPDGSNAIISLKYLVEDDYINSVTNPVTGQKLNECSTIKLIKKNGRMVADSFDEANGSCNDSEAIVKIYTPHAPDVENPIFVKQDKETKIQTKVEPDDKHDDWFNSNVLKENEDLLVKITGKSDKRVSISACNNNKLIEDEITVTNNHGNLALTPEERKKFVIQDMVSYSKDTTEKKMCYRIFSGPNEFVDTEIRGKVDRNAPDVKITNPYDGLWFNIAAKNDTGLNGFSLKVEGEELVSGLDNFAYAYPKGKASEDPKVVYTNYDVNGQDFSKDGGRLEKKDSGKYEFITTRYSKNRDEYTAIRVCDKAGNCKYDNTVISIDTQAPVCENSVNVNKKDKMYNGWYNIATGRPTLTLAATDPSKDDYPGKMSEDENDSVTPTIEQGNKDYTHKFMDYAGNSVDCKETIKYDSERPTITFSKSKDDIPSGWSNIYKNGLSVTAYATDQTSKIDTLTKYQNGNGLSTSTPSDANIKVSGAKSNVNKTNESIGFDLKNYEDGYKIVRVEACDYAENCSNEYVEAKIDTTPPTDVGSEVRKNNNSGQIVSDFNANKWRKGVYWWGNWNATDSLSGIGNYEYSLDGKAKQNDLAQNGYTYGSSDNLNKKSTYYIRAVDKVGNASAWTGPYYFKIDNTPPTNVNSEVRENNNKGNEVSDFGTDKWRKGVYWWGNWQSTDNYSGTDHYEYSLDGKAKQNELAQNGYTYGSSDNPNKKSTYYIRAVDKVGNASAWTGPYYFKIDNTPPIIENIQMPIKKRGAGYCGANVNALVIIFRVKDELSGVDGIRHYMDERTNGTSYTFDGIWDDGHISVDNGRVYVERINGTVISNKSWTINGRTYENSAYSNSSKTQWNVIRGWAYSDTRISGCTWKGSKQKPGTDPNNYCYYVAAKDKVGNKAAQRFCNQ